VPAFVIFAVAAMSLALPLLLWAMFARPDRVANRSLANLQRGLLPGADDPAPGGRTGGGGLAALALCLTPPGTVRRLDLQLSRAGRPTAWPLQRLLVGKFVLGLIAGALSLLYVHSAASPIAVAVGVVVTTVAFFLPDLLLSSRGKERSQRIQRELADTLDQMTIAVEAGLGFDSALARSGKNGTGPLAEELVRTLQDIQVGQSRRQAYEALATRSNVPDLRRFIRAVIQADTYGISIADVLRTQADEMRMKRRQRAEEKAMQIPVKVIFPLMLCILPVLFIVLLGPAVMGIVAAFST
jgi:tight adherence protein C